jgi:hypothetical protein
MALRGEFSARYIKVTFTFMAGWAEIAIFEWFLA